MEVVMKLFNRNYMKIQRHAFSTNINSHSMFGDIDDLIRQKENLISFIKSEYSISIIYNLLLSVSSLIFLSKKFDDLFAFDKISTIWIFLISLIQILEILPKAIIMFQTFRIEKNNSDPLICSRRLMHMTRSNIYYYNTLLGYAHLALYTAYFLIVKKPTNVPNNCLKMYKNINIMILAFFIRLLISFGYFYLHFSQNESGDSSGDTDFSKRAPPDVIKMIESHIITKENLDKLIPLNDEKERDVCCICMNNFSLSETVKILPCNDKHIFHKDCIEKWLSHNKACPNCRKEVTRSNCSKIKMF